MEIPRTQRVPGLSWQSVVNSLWWIYGVSSVLEQISEYHPVWEGCAGGPILSAGLLPQSLLPVSHPPPLLIHTTQPLSGAHPMVKARAGLSDSRTVLFWGQVGYSSWRAISHFCYMPQTSFLSPTPSWRRNPADCVSLSSCQGPSHRPDSPAWTFAQVIPLLGRIHSCSFTI